MIKIKIKKKKKTACVRLDGDISSNEFVRAEI